MNNKYKHKGVKKILLSLSKVIFFIILSYLAVRVGMLGGSFIGGMDAKIIQNIDVDTFKTTLNNSLPLIDAVYNSGNISVSFSGEIENLIYDIFGFDLNNPITVLNAQSPIFYSYYDKSYQPAVAEQNKNDTDGIRVVENDTDDTSNSNNPNSKDSPNNTADENENVKLKQDASSITVDETDEKENSNAGVITSGKITIQNETKYKINIEELLKQPLKFKFDKKGPKILIYHTHTSEAYVPTAKDLNKKGIPSRTQDPRYSVVRVGEGLAQYLRKDFNIDVIHNGTVHDYPNYNGAYGRSLDTVTKILKSYPSIKVTIDLHRDGLGENQKLRKVATINKKNAAQVMFVVGTDQNGLSNPNWKENLKLAIKLQDRLNQISPGLTKPIDISANRYNEHLAVGGLLIEFGGDGNTVDECLESTKYVARALNDVINVKTK